MTVLTHGHRETVHLPAYSALTVVASAAGSGSIVRLGAGSEGDVLTIVSGVPTWQAPA